MRLPPWFVPLLLAHLPIETIGARAASLAQEELPSVDIAVLVDGPWQQNELVEGLFRTEISGLLASEYDVRFPASLRKVGEWTGASVRVALDELLADPEVDLILALGVLAGSEAGSRDALDKPVIAPFIVDPTLQGMPSSDGTSGVANLAYLGFPNDMVRDLNVFRDLAPFDRVTILVNRGVSQGIPGMAARFDAACREAQVGYDVVEVDLDVDAALAELPDQAEAVYIAPLLQLPDTEWDRLVTELNARGLPTFSLFGVAEVERGVFACLAPDTTFDRIARRAALYVQRILSGEPAESLPVSVSAIERLSINMRTARQINVWPSFRALTEAQLIHDEAAPSARPLDLSTTMLEAMQRNLDLAAIDSFVDSGAEEIPLARSQFLPQVAIGASGLLVDEDRAEAGFGQISERTVTVSAAVDQLIWSEPARANLHVQHELQAGREEEREELRLDIGLVSGQAYLNVLRATTFLRIRRDDLELTRQNLELARIREEVGFSRPAETLRWESRMASSRQNVITAQADLALAKIEVNRILNRPLEEPFVTLEAGLEDPTFNLDLDRIQPFIDNPYTFRYFREFNVFEGLGRAPELRRIEALTRAQNRNLLAAKRAFYVPTVFLRGAVDSRVAEGGAGAGLSRDNDTDLSVSLNANFNLFTGGANSARRRQSRHDLIQLRMELQSAQLAIEQRIRASMHVASASWSNIRLSEDAARAARENLKLVTNSYREGLVPILDLLDAQNSSITAQQAAANAVYDFLVDLLGVQRAVGRFDIYSSPAEREAWFERLHTYFEANGIPLRTR